MRPPTCQSQQLPFRCPPAGGLFFALVLCLGGCSHCDPAERASPAGPVPEADGEVQVRSGTADVATPITEPASCGSNSVAVSFPAERFGHTATRLGGVTIVAGGYADRPQERCLAATVLVDGEAREQWVEPRWAHSATAVGDRILVVGGSVDDPELSPPRIATSGWLSATAQPPWSAAPEPVVQRAWHAAAAWEGGVVIAGGRVADASSPSVEFLGPGALAWTPLPPLPAPAYGGTLVSAGDRLVFAGGAQGSGCGADCAKDCAADEDCRPGVLCNRMSFCYEPVSAVWTWTAGHEQWTRVAMKIGVGASLTPLPDGSVLAAGGFDGKEAQGAIWRITAGKPRRIAILTPRFHHTATIIPDGRVVFAGGESLTPCAEPDCDRGIRTPIATVEIFDPSTSAITPGSPLQFARDGHTAWSTVDGDVEILGGVGADGVLAPPERLRF